MFGLCPGRDFPLLPGDARRRRPHAAGLAGRGRASVLRASCVACAVAPGHRPVRADHRITAAGRTYARRAGSGRDWDGRGPGPRRSGIRYSGFQPGKQPILFCG